MRLIHQIFPQTPSVVVLAVISVSLVVDSRPACAGGGLISNQNAHRYGLDRAWFSQAEVDPSQHRVERAVLDGDLLFVLTTAGVLHAMDAETGATVWITRIGNPNYPSLGPATNDQYVAVVNGSTLTVVKRDNGVEKMSVQLGGGAGGGPALTQKYVYVPMFTGKMEAYSLADTRSQPWYYSSTGRIFDSPVTTTESVVWPTDRGYLYVANHDASGVRYRFESSGQIVAEPASYDGNLYPASTNGYVYSLLESSGAQQWRSATGGAITRSPVVISGNVYVATERPALFSLDASNGRVRWEAPGIAQLVGVSPTRVYGIDRFGDITIVDRESGVWLGELPSNAATIAVLNAETDRLYLVSETGLVQCLHEIGSDKPYLHTPPETPAPKDGEAGGADATRPAAEQPPADGNAEDEPADENPFGAPADNPNPFDANPFGGGDDTANDNPFDF